MSARGIRFSDNRFSFRWGIIPFFRRIRLPELDFSEPRESRAGLEFKALQQYALKIPQSLGPPRVQSLRKHHEPRRSRSCRWSLRAARSRASFAYADTEQRQERSLAVTNPAAQLLIFSTKRVFFSGAGNLTLARKKK